MYRYAQQRIEELLPITPDDMPLEHPLMQELCIVSGIVEDYENEHCPIGKPTLGQISPYEILEESPVMVAESEMSSYGRHNMKK